MGISRKNSNLLWGKAAGICSKPGCGYDCTQDSTASNPVALGEMAHMIAKKPGGPRGIAGGGSDSYDNLILLCPTHHKEIDKADEGVYPPEKLRQWKASHEENIRASCSGAKYGSLKSMACSIQKLLIQNHQIWKDFSPESAEAKSNPLSNLADVWELQKLTKLVPNNQKIINIIEKSPDFFDAEDWKIFYQFCAHATGFEMNCYNRTEGVKRFPQKFAEAINRHAV